MKKFIYILFLIVNSAVAFSQKGNDDSQLAMEYYRNKEYDKASEIYLKLFNQTKSKVYYNYYTYCLLELKNYEDLEKFIKKEIKKSPDDLTLNVDLGFVYKSQNKTNEAKNSFDDAIKGLYSDQQLIFNVANAFIAKRELEYAEQTYLKGRKLLKDLYPFSLELANIYQQQRNYQKMIDEYLYLLDISESYIQSVQNRLQNTIYSDPDSSLTELLKTSLIKKTQKDPGKEIFSELLIWLYTQDKEFSKALIQAKALDKRNKETGERIITLARLALSNQDFETAINAYKYIIEKGIDGEYYVVAKNEYLNTIYQKIILTNDFTHEEISTLEKSYLTTLSELGEKSTTISLIKELSHIQAFFLKKNGEAIERLEKAITLPGLKPLDIAECKVELGDIYLLDGDIWTATIYYAQVEKNYENQPIGHEAKFKKSKLAYYAGDFKWAQAQLDVLKASTSKLIANDAFYLSSIINDNTVDSSETPLKMYSRADLAIYRNQDSLALLTLDSITTEYPTHSLSDDVLYLKAKILLKEKKYDLAVDLLQKIISDYSFDILADDAAFKLAQTYDYILGDKEKAKESYKNLLIKFPGSIYVPEARTRFRSLRGDILNKEKTGYSNS